MKCEKCGKEIPEGENKICDDCKKELLKSLDDKVASEETKEEVKEKVAEEKAEVKTEEKKEKKCCKKCSKKVCYIGVAVVLIILLVLAGLKFGLFDIFQKNKVGNTVGNIRNYGYSTVQGQYIYYVALEPDGSKAAIYRAKKDGSNIKMLLSNDWEILSLNVKDDYIYFIALSDQPVESSANLETGESLDDVDNKIYRMKTDGSNLEIINSNEFHNQCYEAYVSNDKIYYIGTDLNIWCMGLDGTNKTKVNSDETGFLGITDKNIILNLKKESTEKPAESAEGEQAAADETIEFVTYVMDLQGNNRVALTGERLYSINVVGNYIYYVNADMHICKVKMDGTDNQVVSETEQAYNLNVDKKAIYYMTFIDTAKSKVGLIKMDLDGQNREVIYEFESSSTFLNIIDGKLVFMDSNNNEASINMLSSDGSKRTKLYTYTRPETTVDDTSVVEDVAPVETEETVPETEEVEQPEQ